MTDAALHSNPIAGIHGEIIDERLLHHRVCDHTGHRDEKPGGFNRG